MKLVRLAEFLALKHKLATSPMEVEASLRKKIPVLWSYPNKLFNILKACAESDPGKPGDPNEKKAVAGFKFCQELLSLINYLQSNWLNISLGEIREVLHTIVQLIENNKDLRFSPAGVPSDKGEPASIQFPHVSELIFQMVPVSKKYDVKLRNELFGKAKTGLSRILSFSLSMLEDLDRLEVMVPEKFTHKNFTDVDIDQKRPERFKPQRSMLSEYDIVDFIRQHGLDYGIPTREDWGVVLRDNPELKEDMTTVINALNRGHYPKDSPDVKKQIADILQRHREKLTTNAPLFEDTEEGT